VDKIISILDGGTLNITLDGDVVQDLKDGKIDPALFGVIDSIFVWAENKPTTCGRIELGPFISGHLNVSYPTCHRSGQAFDVVVLGVDGTETQQKTCQNELMNDLKAFSNITIIHEDAKNGQLAHLHIQTVNCLAK